MMNMYGVVNIDIVGSRKLSDSKRSKVQETLRDYFNYVTKEYSDILIAPIEFTLGDEWQLITKEPSQCYNIIHSFQQLLWKDEVDIYAGIGIGPISTNIYNDTRKMDGQCFVNARKAVTLVKEKNSYNNKYTTSKKNRVLFFMETDKSNNLFYNHLYKSSSHNPWRDEIALTGENEDGSWDHSYKDLNLFNIVNVIIENTEILKGRMTGKQKQTYVDYIKFGSYREIIKASNSDSKGESISSISQKINKAEFFTIQRNHEIVEQLLGYYCAIRR